MKYILKAFCHDCNVELTYTGDQKLLHPPLEIHICPQCQQEYWISEHVYPRTNNCQPRERPDVVNLKPEEPFQKAEFAWKATHQAQLYFQDLSDHMSWIKPEDRASVSKMSVNEPKDDTDD